MPSKSIHIAANDKILFFFFFFLGWVYLYHIVYVYHIFFIRLSIRDT